MNRMKLLTLLLSAVLAALMCTPALAAEVDSDAVYCFTAQDFGENGEKLTGICITALPDGRAGTVKLGRRILQPGDILTANQAEKLTFSPAPSQKNTSARMCFLPIYENRVEKNSLLTISIRGKEDKAPVAEDSVLETYRNLPNEGKLKVQDPEGKALTYTLCRSPRRGTVELGQDGSFCYTPKKNKVGVDSFTFTAADPAGNVSREATVTIQILKPADARQYTDTLGNSCRFEAEWLKNTGLFVGEKVNGQECFYPEMPVTRGQFLAMMVELLDVPAKQVNSELLPESAPQWLKPYLTAAIRSGMTENVPDWETASFDAPVTGAEAAVMIQNALDLTVSQQALETMAPEGEEAPQWAASSLQILKENGLSLTGQQVLTRASAAETLYTVRELSLTAPGTAVFRIQK